MVNIPFIYQYDIAGIVISLFCLIFVIYTNRNIRTQHSKMFIPLTMSNIFACAFDIWADIILNNATLYNVIYDKSYLFAINSIYFVFKSLTPFLWLAYVILAIRKVPRLKPIHIIALLPVLTCLTIIATNPIHNKAFYIDDSLTYIRGPLMYVIYGTIESYFIYGIIASFVYRKFLPKGEYIIVSIYAVCLSIAILIPVWKPSILLDGFITSCCLILMVFTIESSSTKDPISGIYNRRNFILETKRMKKFKQNYKLIVIKLKDISYYNRITEVNKVHAITREIGYFLDRIPGTCAFDLDNQRFCLQLSVKADYEKILNLVKDKLSSKFTYAASEVQYQVFMIDTSTIDTVEKILMLIDTPYTSSNETSKEILNRIEREMEIEEALERAIANRSIEVFYQPIYSSKTKSFHSAEALARIFDSKYGFISPAEFIPVAEKTGKITELGDIMFENVLKLIKETDLKKLGVKYIEINLSAYQIIDIKLYEKFTNKIKEHNIDPSMINFEITESAVINNINSVSSTVSKFAEDGIYFSLDDFGTGYSNFDYLVQIPFKIIKLDKSLLDHAEENEKANLLHNSVINMIKGAKIQVLQEGAERKEQVDALLEVGIDYIQGFYYSQAIPKDEFIAFIMKYNSEHIDKNA